MGDEANTQLPDVAQLDTHTALSVLAQHGVDELHLGPPTATLHAIWIAMRVPSLTYMIINPQLSLPLSLRTNGARTSRY